MKLYIDLNIKYLCKSKSLTEEEFGALFGLSQGVVNTYSRGRSAPKPEMIQQICGHFGISIDDFFNVDLSKKEYLVSESLPQVTDIEEQYKSQSKIIATLEKTNTLLERQVALLEKEIENLQDQLKVS